MSTKENVLKALEEKKGSYISGEELAGKLGVSRNSVWKAVRDLKKAGYMIASVTNRGYSLNKTSDIISVQGISTYINHKEIIQDIEVYDELASTNMLAKEKAVIGTIDKRVIVARKQTEGRGHRNKNFFSPDGGIYLSIILNPEQVKGLNLPVFAAVAVTDVLEEAFIMAESDDNHYENEIGIKWINSIYMGDEKICGILTESISDMETGEIGSYVLGIGINCKLKNKNRIIAGIVNRLFYPGEFYNDKSITDRYQSKLLYIDKRVKFTLYGENKEEFYAVVLGIENNGKLIVKKDDGTKIYLDKGYMAV